MPYLVTTGSAKGSLPTLLKPTLRTGKLLWGFPKSLLFSWLNKPNSLSLFFIGEVLLLRCALNLFILLPVLISWVTVVELNEGDFGARESFMSFAVPFKAKFPTWPEVMSTECSPWRTVQLILSINYVVSPAFAGVNSWNAREEDMVEEEMSSPWWEVAGMAVLHTQG